MKINFYPRKSSSDQTTIYLWVSWSGNQEPFNTRVRVYQKHWDKKKQKVKENIEGSEQVNKDLQTLADKVRQLFRDYPEKTITKDQIKGVVSNDIIISGQIDNLVDLFKKVIKESETGERRTKHGKMIDKGTIKNYRVTLANLEKFPESTKFKDLNHLWYNRFTNFLWDQRKYYDNSVGGQISRLKLALNYGVESGVIKEKIYNNKWITWREEIDILVIYPEELRVLSQIEFDSDRISRTRDIFLMGCMTCFRVSNLLSLTEDDLLNDSIRVLSVKTLKPIFIKLNPVAMGIINKYRGKYNTLLPEISDQKFNKNLKDMAKELKKYISDENLKLVGNDWSKPFIRTRYKRGQAVRVKTEITEMISSHTMRRTGITNLLMSGLSEIEVKAISGHSFGSREFGKYVKIAEQFIDRKAASAWEQIFRVG